MDIHIPFGYGDPFGSTLQQYVSRDREFFKGEEYLYSE